MASTTDVKTMNGTQETSQSITQDLDVHFSRSSHTGLSALLNAVTLHIAKSDDNKDDPKPHKNGVNGSDSDDCHRDAPPYTTTPTMVPEGGESQKHTFPGILMTLLLDPVNENTLTFLPDGKYFVLQKDDFAANLMMEKFKYVNYESFLDELSRWGFSPVETKRPGIEVYRHRLFRKGDWKRCGQMVIGETTEASEPPKELPPPVSGSNSRTSSMSEDDLLLDRSASSESAKRRLSPTSAAKSNHGSISKLRVNGSDDDSSSSAAIDPAQKAADLRRSMALSITTEKLKIRESDDREGFPLVQQAVVGATHTIVTDAIEALLRDEDHSRKTFEKHADELSKSSLPGLVPISRQLFSVGENNTTTPAATPAGTAAASAAPTATTTTEATIATETATTPTTIVTESMQQNGADEKRGAAEDSEKAASKS